MQDNLDEIFECSISFWKNQYKNTTLYKNLKNIFIKYMQANLDQKAVIKQELKHAKEVFDSFCDLDPENKKEQLTKKDENKLKNLYDQHIKSCLNETI